MMITDVRSGRDTRIGAIASAASPENKTCRLFGAARGKHSMHGAISVNRFCGAATLQPVLQSHCNALLTEHVDALARTLAPESRHIVAFKTSGTTSRAVVFDPLVAAVRRKRPGALFALGED
jgi:hypothetical protein